MGKTISAYENKKYAILFFINTRLSQAAAEKALADLPKLLGISERQLRRYIYADKDDVTEARPSYLSKAAAYLSGATGETVTVNDLLIY